MSSYLERAILFLLFGFTISVPAPTCRSKQFDTQPVLQCMTLARSSHQRMCIRNAETRMRDLDLRAKDLLRPTRKQRKVPDIRHGAYHALFTALAPPLFSHPLPLRFCIRYRVFLALLGNVSPRWPDTLELSERRQRYSKVNGTFPFVPYRLEGQDAHQNPKQRGGAASGNSGGTGPNGPSQPPSTRRPRPASPTVTLPTSSSAASLPTKNSGDRFSLLNERLFRSSGFSSDG